MYDLAPIAIQMPKIVRKVKCDSVVCLGLPHSSLTVVPNRT